MSQFVEGIKSLFGGDSAQKRELAKQREQQSIALDRQNQIAQNSSQYEEEQLSRVSRIPRGRRLLLAATGEGGTSSTLGG